MPLARKNSRSPLRGRLTGSSRPTETGAVRSPDRRGRCSAFPDIRSHFRRLCADRLPLAGDEPRGPTSQGRSSRCPTVAGAGRRRRPRRPKIRHRRQARPPAAAAAACSRGALDRQSNTPPAEAQTADSSAAGKSQSPAGAARRRQQPPPAASAASGRYVTIDFDNVDIQVFIKFVSELTGRNFVIDDKVKGKVTVISPKKIAVDEVYKVFESVLEIYGFATVQAGDVIKVIPALDARGKNLELRLKKEAIAPEDKIVTQILSLQHASPDEMKKVLDPLISKTSIILVLPADGDADHHRRPVQHQTAPGYRDRPRRGGGRGGDLLRSA